MAAIYDGTHELFRQSFAAFVDAEMVPNIDRWEEVGIVDRELFIEAGNHGFLGMAISEDFGGGGVDDFRFNAIISEELAAKGVGGAGSGITLHNDVVAPYFVELCNDDQAARWLPGIAAGELITAIAMTEPGTGSDLASIATTAVKDGDEYIVNGSKTFITNGINADLVITVCVTDPDAGRAGMSLLVLERSMEGFERGRKLDKIGMKSSDTAELFFSDVRVPAANVLGEPGRAFDYLSFNLAQERLSIAVNGVAVAHAALAWTIEYVKERTAFGKQIATFQNTKFELADVATDVRVGQAFMNDCIERHCNGELSPADAAMAKLWGTELQGRAVDRCLQLFGGYGFTIFGGYGFTTEYPIARAHADARVARIYGGTSEIMKTVIAKDILG